MNYQLYYYVHFNFSSRQKITMIENSMSKEYFYQVIQAVSSVRSINQEYSIFHRIISYFL